MFPLRGKNESVERKTPQPASFSPLPPGLRVGIERPRGYQAKRGRDSDQIWRCFGVAPGTQGLQFRGLGLEPGFGSVSLGWT